MSDVVIYVVEWDAFRESGVLKKVHSQVAEWKQFGVKGRLFLVSPQGREPAIQDEFVRIFTYPNWSGGLRKVAKAIAFRRLRTAIARSSANIVLYRQSSWTPGSLNALVGTHKLVVEVNSMELSERDLLYNGIKAKFSGFTYGWLEAHASGYICVSRELATCYQKFGRPIAVVANGYNARGVVPKERARTERPEFAFVCSVDAPWNGLDKLMELAERKPDWGFHVVGPSVRTGPRNVISHGALDWRELDSLYDKCHFGISTLALHRKGMHEASPLKSREYLAYGLPVIGAYDDTDLSGQPYYLQIPNTEDCINASLQSIEQFVHRWNGVHVDRDALISRIDWSHKERARLKFMQEL